MAERTGSDYEMQRRKDAADVQQWCAKLRTELMECRDVLGQASFWLTPQSGEGFEAQTAVRAKIRSIEKLLNVPFEDTLALPVATVNPFEPPEQDRKRWESASLSPRQWAALLLAIVLAARVIFELLT